MIKTDDDIKDIPVVFYSAHYLDHKDREMAENLGVSHFVQKPLETSEFIRVIKHIVAELQLSKKSSAAELRKNEGELKLEHEERLTQMLYGKLEELEENQKKLSAALKGTISTVALAVEVRDPYTAGHQQRVAELAEAIATEMALDELQVEGVRMGSMIHDIGKIQLPAEILSKPTSLSNLEFQMIQTHAQVGYDLLKDIQFPWPVADIAHQHHERMDGSGYPQGLKGDEICLEARIVAVADVVEAISSHRPYRASLGIDAALDEISSKREKFFDAAVVDACLKIFKEKKYSL